MAPSDGRERRNLRAEIYRLAERTENLTRYVEIIEGKLAAMLEQTQAKSATVTVADPILPTHGGASLIAEPRQTGEQPYPALPVQLAPSERYHLDASRWPESGGDKRPLIPTAGWRNYTLQKRNSKVIGFSVCGMPRPVLQATVSTIAHQQDRLRDFIPVFLTDSMEFDVFRRHGFVWEYFPGPAERARYGGTMDWMSYGAARRRLLARKWDFDRIIRIGPIEFGVIDPSTKAPDAEDTFARPDPD